MFSRNPVSSYVSYQKFNDMSNYRTFRSGPPRRRPGEVHPDFVPPSRHTLFFRSFPSNFNIDSVREFFEKESGEKCRVDFFSHCDDNRRLVVALRFETHATAKIILHKFDRKEVLGNEVEITWFKDFRKAKADRNRFVAQKRTNSFGFRDGLHGGRRPIHHRHRSGSSPRHNHVKDSHSQERYKSSVSRSRSRSYSGGDRSQGSARRHSSASYSSRSPSPKSPHQDATKQRCKGSPNYRHSSSTRRQSSVNSGHGEQSDKNYSRSQDTHSPERSMSHDSRDNRRKQKKLKRKKKISRSPTDHSRSASPDYDYNKRPRTPAESGQESEPDVAELNRCSVPSDVYQSEAHSSANNHSAPESMPLRYKSTFKEATPDANSARCSESAKRSCSPNEQGEDFRYNKTKNSENCKDFIYSFNRDVDFKKLSAHDQHKVKMKKEEIEKGYRRDCETCSTVVKMLISKDRNLEEPLLQALKELLRDMAEQCIEDLRNYVRQEAENHQ